MREGKKRRKRRSFLFRFVRAISIVALLAYGAYRAGLAWLESTTFFRDHLRDEIALRFHGDVAVGRATFDVLKRTLRAYDVTLKDPRGGEPGIVLPEIDVRLPSAIVDIHGNIAPESVIVKRAVMRLVERADGSFAPLDLIHVAVTGMAIPTVAIDEGSVVLSGNGRLDALLDEILRTDLSRRVEKVRLASAPMPETSDYLVGFNGNLELPGVAPVTLFGGIGRDDSMRLDLEMRDLDLSSNALRSTLSKPIADLLERHVVSGRVSVEVELELPAAAGAQASIKIDLHAHDLTLRDSTFFARDITGVSLDASFDGSDFRIHDVKIPDAGGELHVDGLIERLIRDQGLDFSDFRFTIRGRDLAFQDSLTSSIKEPELRRIIDDYAPEGRVEAFVELSRRGGQAIRPRWSLKPLAISASYVGHFRDTDHTRLGFPYRVTDLSGEIAGDGNHIEVRHLRGHHAGFGLVDIDGTVDVDGDRTLLDLHFRADNIPLTDNKLRNALDVISPGAGEIVDRFHPTGTVDAEVRVYADPATGDVHRSGVVRPRSVDTRIDDFPFPLRLERGRVEFDDDVYTIYEVEGKGGEATAKVSGSIVAHDHGVAIHTIINARGMRAQDPELHRALDAMLARIATAGKKPFEWSWLDAAGAFDVDVELKQEANDDMRFKALVFPRDLKAVPKWFAIPFEGVVGRIEFGTLDPDTGAPRPFQLEFEDLAARYRSGSLALDGRFVPDTSDYSLDLRGTTLPITGDLLAATDTLLRESSHGVAHETYDPGELVRSVVPGGTASLHLVVPDPTPGEFVAGTGEPETRSLLDLELDGVASHASFLPGGEISSLHGKVQIDLEEGSAKVEGARGELKGGAGRFVSNHLTVGTTFGAVEIAGDVDLVDLPFDSRADAWLPRSVIDSVGLDPSAGALRITFPELHVVAAPTGQHLITATDVDIAFNDLRSLAPFRLENGTGRVRVGEATLRGKGDDDTLLVRGRIGPLVASVGGLRFESVGSEFDIGKEFVDFSHIVGNVAGGALDPDQTWILMRTEEPGWIHGSVDLKDGDLGLLLGQLGIPSAGTRGRFGFKTSIVAPKLALSALTGEGEVEIRNGRLADIPWIATIYRKTLGYVLGEWLEPTFSSGKIEFTRMGDRIRLKSFQLDSAQSAVPIGLRLRGEGELGPTGIDLRIVPEILRTNAPFLSTLLRAITGQIFSYRITGPLSNPRVQYRNLAMELFLPLNDDTNQPRIVEPKAPEWTRRF